MKKSIYVSLLGLMAAAGFSMNLAAQTPTCADVVWSASLLESNPNISKYCLEMVQRGPEWYAVVQAKVVRHGASSTVVRFRELDGSWSSAERVYPPRGFAAEIAGQEVTVSQAVPGQELRVYASSQGGENFTIPMLEASETEGAVEGAMGQVLEETSDQE